MEKIGIGIITYKRPHFFKNCYNSIPWNKIDYAVIVNDGTPYDLNELGIKLNKKTVLIQHETNKKLAVTKNDALRYLYNKECEHIFIVEDDVVILNKNIFDMYINASKETGIMHFNFGPGSPFNRVQDQSIRYDLHNRHLCKQTTPPNPKKIIEYPNNLKIALYEHTVAAFTYYRKITLDTVGWMDEENLNENAWEHVDHTYRIIKAGFHPPFWWFADLADSEKLIKSQKGAIDNSSIATETDVPWEQQEWSKTVKRGMEKYKEKHGHYPNMPPYKTEDDVITNLKELYKKYVK